MSSNMPYGWEWDIRCPVNWDDTPETEEDIKDEDEIEDDEEYYEEEDDD